MFGARIITAQPPGPWVIDHVINTEAELGPRVFAARTPIPLLSVTDHCLRSRDYVT